MVGGRWCHSRFSETGHFGNGQKAKHQVKHTHTHMVGDKWELTLPETNIAPENKPPQ